MRDVLPFLRMIAEPYLNNYLFDAEFKIMTIFLPKTFRVRFKTLELTFYTFFTVVEIDPE